MLCDFQPDGDGQRCSRCGFVVPVKTAKVTKKCAAAAINGKPPAPAGDPTACVHRGEAVRAEPCKSCRGDSIDVPVYACPLYTECTLYDYSRSNAKLADVQVCQRCPARKPAQPALPSLVKRAANYGKAWAIDRATGKPRRPAELVSQIFAQHCLRCPRYNADLGACAECGCPVGADAAREDNKLAWANERCPLGKWPIERANLIYYILPLQHTGRVWQWHVEQLRARLHHFTGRRIITIATPGPGNLLAIEPAAKVIEAFGSDATSIEFLERPNCPHHWETPAFREMLGMVHETRGRGDAERGRAASFSASPPLPLSASPAASATFYGHAKGVRRARWDSIKLWCQAMYRHNLDRVDEVRELLSAYSAVGIAKIPQRPTAIAGPGWHFAGTYFWVNDQELFSRPNWNQIQDHSHAVEGYLATQFEESEAYCLAYLNPPHVYQASTWLNRELEAKEGVGGQRPEVREETAVGRTPTSDLRPLISILVTARNNGPYLEECLKSCLDQTYPALELIYCDDASDDDSVAVARRTFDGSLSPVRCRVLALPANVGVEEARNFAAQQAKGEALLFVDGDNLLTPDYLATMVAALSKETPFVYPDLQRFGEVNRLDRMPEFDPRQFRAANCADTCSLMWAAAFATAGGWKAGFEHLADWHLMLRLSKLGRPARSGAVLLYRDHGQSMSADAKRRLTPDQLAELERRVVADALQ